MIDRVDALRARRRAARARASSSGTIAVDPGDWFFQAHFYQDPVWPGSLGLESFLQLLKSSPWKRWGDRATRGWQTVARWADRTAGSTAARCCPTDQRSDGQAESRRSTTRIDGSRPTASSPSTAASSTR